MNAPFPGTLDWSGIDTVLLDLDGTLLDLGYDSHFWSVMVPEAWGRERGLDLATAQEQLRPILRAPQDTLDWYCIDYWSRVLGLDIPGMKRADAQRVRWLPGAQQFLVRVRGLGKRLVLLTNAHPMTLAIKDGSAGIVRHFDASFSSHAFDAPKEDARCWRGLATVEPYAPERTLFIDDSLPVLRAARAAGIGTLFVVRHPDTTCAPRDHDEFPAIDRVADLLPAA